MDNKPLETDDQEELESEDLFSPDDETPQEPGAEDVGGKSDFTLKLEEISGRTFKDDNDAEKHYRNLSSFVGKKEESPKPVKADLAELMTKVSGLEQAVTERDFIYEKPEAKEHLDLVRSVAKAEGLPMSKAWEKVKEYVGAFEASKKEKTIVDSKSRPNVPQSKEFTALAEKATSEGLNESEQIALMKASGVLK
jgi:hypothetical protein